MASEEFREHDGIPISQLFPPGLTKREYFAAMAMQGILANDPKEVMGYDIAAHAAVKQADALLERLEADDGK